MDRRTSLHKLEILSLVVDLGGIGRAADHLFVTQPVVSSHIRSLEERLGTKLFYREGHTMRLTRAGTLVHAWAEDVLSRTRELDRHLAGLVDGREGTVTLGASMSVGCYALPSVMSSFKATHPSAELRLSISGTEQAVEGTRSGELDCAVVVADNDHNLIDMEVEQVGEDEIVLVDSSAHPETGRALALDELTGLRFVDPPLGAVKRSFIDRRMIRLGLTDPNIILQLTYPEAVKRAVGEGAGVAFQFLAAVTDELESGWLRRVPLTRADLVFPIFVIHRKATTLSPLHRDLIADIRRSYAVTAPVS